MDTKRFLLHSLFGTTTAVLIFLISLMVPVVGVVLSLLTPLPIMVLSRLWGLGAGILSVLIGTSILAIALGPGPGIIFFAEFGLLAILLYHYLVRKHLPWDRAIALSSLFVLVAATFLVILYGLVASVNPIEWVRGEIQETGRSILQIYPLENGENQSLLAISEKLTEFILRILPSLLILTMWLEGMVNTFLFTRIMAVSASGRYRMTMTPAFSTWTCPDSFVWGGILGGFLIITKVPSLATVGINTVILLIAIYFLQGLAIVSFFFKKNNVPLGLRVIGYIMIGIFQFLFFLVAALGLFDMWVNFRKLRPKVTAYEKDS
ncbi:MAG: DUF2232 domain-containing protein [Proteobacteria bacterium]|nr:DUF2232 domain-containing protein [Pseudomonadota bacterium]